MSLRDELAETLAAAGYGLSEAYQAQHPGEGVLGGEWRRVADEGIRQMEWARRNQNGTERDYLTEGGIRYAFQDLTLAPEGWKP